MGAAWLLEFAIVYMATLTPYRMLMTWVYSNTQSLFLAMLMHASFTGWLLVLFPRDLPYAKPVLAIRLCAHAMGSGGVCSGVEIHLDSTKSGGAHRPRQN